MVSALGVGVAGRRVVVRIFLWKGARRIVGAESSWLLFAGPRDPFGVIVVVISWPVAPMRRLVGDETNSASCGLRVARCEERLDPGGGTSICVNLTPIEQ